METDSDAVTEAELVPEDVLDSPVGRAVSDSRAEFVEEGEAVPDRDRAALTDAWADLDTLFDTVLERLGSADKDDERVALVLTDAFAEADADTVSVERAETVCVWVPCGETLVDAVEEGDMVAVRVAETDGLIVNVFQALFEADTDPVGEGVKEGVEEGLADDVLDFDSLVVCVDVLVGRILLEDSDDAVVVFDTEDDRDEEIVPFTLFDTTADFVPERVPVDVRVFVIVDVPERVPVDVRVIVIVDVPERVFVDERVVVLL